MACRETVPGVWGMAAAVPDAMAELVAAARAATSGERHEELDEAADPVAVEVDLTDGVPVMVTDAYPDAG
jgi:hypothetical protein